MSCLNAVLNLVKSWWYVDQIRVPRATGSLLQLRAGERLLIRDEVFIVREKTFVFAPKSKKDETAACAGVRYTLAVHQPMDVTTGFIDRLEDQPANEPTYALDVTLPVETTRSPKIQFIKNGEVEQLFDDDVTLLETG